VSSEVLNPILLLVEDDDDVFFFKRTLSKSGKAFSFHHAPNGSAAIEFIRNAANPELLPQIIFLDLKMPVLNGFDVLDWMQKQRFPRAVPVVILSGSEQQNDMDRARLMGAIDYLVKPVRENDLIRLLNLVSLPADRAATSKNEASN
jgi:CheY-like chemotaxis protein